MNRLVNKHQYIMNSMMKTDKIGNEGYLKIFVYFDNIVY